MQSPVLHQTAEPQEALWHNSYTHIFDVFDNNEINSRKSVRNLLWFVLISSTSLTLSCTEYAACSMNLWCLWHTLELAKVAFLTNQFFVGKIAHLHNWPTWPSYPFALCQQLSWMTCLVVLEGILRLFLQLALTFYWDKTCVSSTYVQLLDWSNQGEVQAIRLRWVWVTWYPAFDAEACELANLLAHVSQLCQKLNLPTPKELYRPTFFKHWRHFSDLNWYTRQAVWLGYEGGSFVPIDM